MSSGRTVSEIDQTLSRHFSTMSFISALLIVYLHTGSSIKGEPIGHLCHAALCQICRAAIPWFFFAAGYFLARHIAEKDWWRIEVRKRVRTLLVPFWIWGTIIALSWIMMAVLIRMFEYHYNGIDAFQWLSLKGIATVLGLNPFANIPTMWFLRTLFVFVVISPLVGGKGLAVALAFIVYVVFKVYYFDVGEDLRYVFTTLISLRGLAYFSLGMWVSCRNLKISRWCGVALVIVALALFPLILVLDNGGVSARLIDVFMVPGTMLLIWVFAGRFPLPSTITSMSFPLYLLHSTIAYFASALYGVIGCGQGRTCFLLGIMRFLFCVGMSLVITLCLRRLVPRCSAIVFGGR